MVYSRPLPRLLGISLASLLTCLGNTASAEVVDGNVIVQGSLCVGFDCAKDQDFLGSTLMLKENNTRIRLEDSDAPAVLGQSWNLEANSPTNGGPNYFRIELKATDASAVAPILTLAPAGSGEVTLGRESETVAGQLSVGKADLLRRLRHVAQGVAETDVLIRRSLEDYSTLEDRRALVAQLAGQVEELETRIAALESGDLDGDGVSNIDDACPDTPAGEPVDGSGCAASQRDSDNDGIDDDQDDFPNAVTEVTVDGVTLTTTPTSADSSCSLQTARTRAVAELPAPPGRVRPLDIAVEFTLEGCSPGEAIAIEVDLGVEIPEDFQAFKIAESWLEIGDATLSGSTLRYTLVDGGPYDADGVANGVIVDPVTAALPARAAPVPALPLWLLAGLAVMLGGLGLRMLRRN